LHAVADLRRSEVFDAEIAIGRWVGFEDPADQLFGVEVRL
jgi:hypothetical protein